MKKLTSVKLIGGLSMASSLPAFAQEINLEAVSRQEAAQTGQNGIPDIVVTASRRSSSVQAIPLAVTAIDGATMQTKGIVDIANLTKVAPTVQVLTSGFTPQIYIRGIGLAQLELGGEPGVALHINGVYLARARSLAAGFFDMERVEVLRGPQGTLYGRNATGGAINIITAAPTSSFAGYATAELGNYNRVRVEGAISGPLSPELEARIAGFYENRKSYATNLATGQRIGHPSSGATRISLAYRPTGSKFESSLVADYLQRNKDPSVIKVRALYDTVPGAYVQTPPGRYDSDPYQVYNDFKSDARTRLWGVSWTNTFDLDRSSLKSITGYRSSSFRQQLDYDGTDKPNLNLTLGTERSRTFSQELQLASQAGDRFSWLVGIFYFHEKASAVNNYFITSNFGTVSVPTLVSYNLLISPSQKTESYAAFGQAAYEIVPGLKATLGLRYNKDRKSLRTRQQLPEFQTDASAALDANFDAVTPKFGLEYTFPDRTLVFATATRGYKAGGFNATQPTQTSAFGPERLWAYEIGVKRDWFDRRLRTNVSAYQSYYSDLQVTQLIGNPPASVITNAGRARIRGVELETLLRISTVLNLRGSFAYLDAIYRRSSPAFMLRDPVSGQNSDMTGLALPNAPRFTYSIGGDYTARFAGVPGSFTLTADWLRKSASFLDSLDKDTERQPGYGLLDLRISYLIENGKADIALFARNALDKSYFTALQRAAPPIGGAAGVIGEPAVYGLQARIRI